MARCFADSADEETDELSSEDEKTSIEYKEGRPLIRARAASANEPRTCPKQHPLKLQPTSTDKACNVCEKAGHQQMHGCHVCSYDECPACFDRHEDIKDIFDHQRVLETQLHILAHMHFVLPHSPVAFICHYLDGEFLFYYIEKRARWTSVTMLLFACFLGAAPWLYGQTLMPYPCRKKDFFEEGVVHHNETHVWSEMELRQKGCNVEDWLRSKEALHAVYEITGLNFVLTVTIIFLSHCCPMFQRMLLPFAKHLLPRVLYNGCAAAGTKHSAWKLFSTAGVEHHYSYMHDFFGSTDIISYCMSSVVSTAVYLVYVGWKQGGKSGASVGAVIGALLARYMLQFMDQLFGASSELIDMVDETFSKQLPHEDVLNTEEIKYDRIESGLQIALQKVNKLAKTDEERERMMTDIRRHGKRIILYIAKWMQRKLVERQERPTSLLDLFNSHTTNFVCHELALSSFLFLNLAHFLMLYFDTSEEMCPEWRNDRTLTSVYVSRPDHILCTYEKPHWRCEWIQDMERRMKPASANGDSYEAVLEP